MRARPSPQDISAQTGHETEAGWSCFLPRPHALVVTLGRVARGGLQGGSLTVPTAPTVRGCSRLWAPLRHEGDPQL